MRGVVGVLEFEPSRRNELPYNHAQKLENRGATNGLNDLRFQRALFTSYKSN
jgi:hypothetical protein